MPPLSTTDISFSNVVDLYLSEVRSGRTIPIDMLAKMFPHLANQIREDLPAVAMLESSCNKQTVARPEVIGNCRITREIGRGAMGVVYEAQQIDIDRAVALKLIPLNNSKSSFPERFEIEARALGRIEHPNVVPVYAFGREQNYAYIVMKLIEGASILELFQADETNLSLQYRFNELRNDWNVLARFAADVVSGLRLLHENNLVHRDIKPANLLLDADGKVWLTDFGLVKFFDSANSLSRTGDAVGTPRYMAPEQLRGLCDGRSDIYSLGITLYEIVAGDRVWANKSLIEVTSKRSTLAIPHLKTIREDVPSELADLIMKCIALDPDRRYQSAAELLNVLSRFAQGKSKCDRRRGSRMSDEQYKKYSRRRTLQIMGGSTILLPIAIAIGVLWSKPKQLGSGSSQAAKPASRATVDLIDRLADEKNDNMLQMVTKYVKESVDETSDKLDYSAAAKDQILTQIDRITQQIDQQGGITEESLNNFLHEYRQTTLPSATRVMRATLSVRDSSLTRNEKEIALVMVRKFATATANGFIPTDEANGIMLTLYGDNYGVGATSVPDNSLRNWLNWIDQRMSRLPSNAFDLSRALETELSRALEATNIQK